MAKPLARGFSALFLLWGLATLAAGYWVLPPLLLQVPLPVRSEKDRESIRASLQRPGERWTMTSLQGGEGRRLELWRLHRVQEKGVVIYLHGFGDDAWGTVGRAAELPEWGAASFTFRGRDRDPSIPCTMGAWERKDVVAVVHHLLNEGVPAQRLVVAAWSMGAGVALLALEDLEKEGTRLGGALLECPFEDLRSAAQDHVKGTLGPFELLARPAEELALFRGGRLANFQPGSVSPALAVPSLKGPIAYVSGSADQETPLPGVQRVAGDHADLTVVPGAGHCQASNQLPGGWGHWARQRLARWGY
ncbi:MAG: alpha/beta fold hydrolase [Acidobacteria bacterium]|nr:alpha/beta fold hydrolase [Acidobacteriota bacterium]